MAEPGMELKRLRWPSWDSVSRVQLDALPGDPWQAPDDDGLYIAIDRSPPSTQESNGGIGWP